MDLRMPVMNGTEAIRRIRARVDGDRVKIVAVSASVFSEEREDILVAGADGFLGKPLREADLFGRLRTLLGVEFVFEDQSAPEPAPAVHPVAGPESSGRTVAPELAAALRNAVEQADVDRLLELVGRLEAGNAALAAELRRLAGGFEYKRILALLEAGG
jgi:CheY-like chemotaxis protein